MEITQQRKDALKKVLREGNISLPEAENFIIRLQRLGFVDREWKIIPERFKALENNEELKKVPTEIGNLTDLDKEVLGVINTYPGLTQEIIQLAFAESQETLITNSIRKLADKSLVFTVNSEYYPTLASKK